VVVQFLAALVVFLTALTPIETAAQWATSATSPTSRGADLVEGGILGWASEPLGTDGQPVPGWQARVRLQADQAMLDTVLVQTQAANPGRTITADSITTRFGPALEQRAGTTADRCWVALYTPIVATQMLAATAPDESEATEASEATQAPQPAAAVTFDDKVVLAVLPFRDANDEDRTVLGPGYLVSMAMISMIDAPNVTLVERDAVRDILNARAFSEIDATRDENGIFLGRLLNARFLLTGSVDQVGPDEWLLTGRIIDATTGEIVDGHRAAVVIQGTRSDLVRGAMQLATAMGLRTPPTETPKPMVLLDRAQPGTVESMVRIVPRDWPSPLALSVLPAGLVHEEGQRLHVQVETQLAGYLTLVAIGPDGQITVLAPNRDARSLKLSKGQSITIPTQDMDFSFPVKPPHGLTRVKAFITPKPLIVPGSFSDDRDLLLKLARNQSLGEAENDPLAQPGWTSQEVVFLTRPATAPANSPASP
jgi:TolB-like protein